MNDDGKVVHADAWKEKKEADKRKKVEKRLQKELSQPASVGMLEGFKQTVQQAQYKNEQYINSLFTQLHGLIHALKDNGVITDEQITAGVEKLAERLKKDAEKEEKE